MVYSWIPIAETGARFAEFAPYVASVNERGAVAFQATLRGGGSGVYRASGASIETIIETDTLRVESHPDMNAAGDACFYARDVQGETGLYVVRRGEFRCLALRAGPLGPTMNEKGAIAFRADGIHVASESGEVRTLARVGERFSAFHGLPVINDAGQVAFRADTREGSQGVYLAEAAGDPAVVVEMAPGSVTLGSFPSLNERGVVACAASAAIFTSAGGWIDFAEAFESVRGALITDAGGVIFYATPRGGALGIYTGPAMSCTLAIGGPLFGSTVIDFALNPVSINRRPQLAVRVKLTDGRQLIARGDPPTFLSRA